MSTVVQVEGIETDRFFSYLLKLGFCRCSKQSHDMEELIIVVSASEKWSASYHLCEDTTTRPDIDGGAVGPRT